MNESKWKSVWLIYEIKTKLKVGDFFFKFLEILYKIWDTFKFLKFVMHEWKSVDKLFYDNIFEKKIIAKRVSLHKIKISEFEVIFIIKDYSLLPSVIIY